MDWVHHIERSDSSPAIYLYGKYIHFTASLFTSLKAATYVSQIQNSKYAQYEVHIFKNQFIFHISLSVTLFGIHVRRSTFFTIYIHCLAAYHPTEAQNKVTNYFAPSCYTDVNNMNKHRTINYAHVP